MNSLDRWLMAQAVGLAPQPEPPQPEPCRLAQATVVDALNSWPVGTRGHAQAARALVELHELIAAYSAPSVEAATRAVWTAVDATWGTPPPPGSLTTALQRDIARIGRACGFGALRQFVAWLADLDAHPERLAAHVSRRDRHRALVVAAACAPA